MRGKVALHPLLGMREVTNTIQFVLPRVHILASPKFDRIHLACFEPTP
jgi:hypothetical protein